MPFSTVVYTADNGDKWKCRLSAASIAAQPTAPGTSGFDVPLFATVGESPRKYGLHVRHANLKRLVGSSPNQFYRTTKLPIMTQADATELEGTGTVTVNGTAWIVESITGESKR